MAAQPAGTFDVYDSKGNRQSWINAIYDISPDDTPLISAIGKQETDNIRHSWQTDRLRAAVGTNAHVEGGDYDYIDRTPTVEVSNITQISIDPFLISGTNEAVRKWGRGSEIAYQKARSMKVVKMDIEMSVLGIAQGSVLGSSSVARRSGSLNSWLATNVDLGGTAVAGGYNTGTSLTVAPTVGTPRAFTETMIKTVMEKLFNSGGDARTAYMSSKQKKVFSTFAGIAQLRKNVPQSGQVTITAAADAYVSDFGTIAVTPVRQIRNSDVFILDHDMLGIAYLRPFETERLAKTGDSEKFNVIAEWTLVVKNEASHGYIQDLS